MLALTGYELGLLIVALVFIAFALTVALVIPRSRPTFPAKRFGWFIAICLVLFVAQFAAVLALAELGEEGEAAEGDEPPVTETAPSPDDPPPGGSPPPEPPMPPPPGTGTETEETETTDQDGEVDAAEGKQVFLANCGSCHTFADAGTDGQVGPNLDEAQPDTALVVDRVTNGQGAMPAFAETLSEQQIADVAAYVSSSAG